MSESNISQRDYWSGPVGQSWAIDCDLFDALLAPVLDALLSMASLEPGNRVLDVGCGAGASTFAAAMQVGASGHVSGIDISEVLLDRAREKARISQAKAVSFTLADAQVAEFQDPFDAMISRLGMMFFSDPVSAFTNISNALRPDARLTFACWSQRSENPWFNFPVLVRDRLRATPTSVDTHAPGPIAFADSDWVLGLMTQAGLRNVAAERMPVLIPAGPSISDAVDLTLRIGPVKSVLAEMGATPDALAQIKQTLADLMSDYLGPDGVLLPAGLIIYTAQA